MWPTDSFAFWMVIHRFLFTFQLVLAIARNAMARPDQKNERAIPDAVGKENGSGRPPHNMPTLPNYTKAGFVLYKQETLRREL